MFKEERKDLWEFYDKPNYKVFITVSGSLKANGSLVMDRGCAKEATMRFPDIAVKLGEHLKVIKSIPALDDKTTQALSYPCTFWATDYSIGLFPIKYNWYDRADLKLIEESTKQLKFFADEFKDCTIVLPRPGCNSGGRNWEAEIYPILEKHLDERFLVVYK